MTLPTNSSLDPASPARLIQNDVAHRSPCRIEIHPCPADPERFLARSRPALSDLKGSIGWLLATLAHLRTRSARGFYR